MLEPIQWLYNEYGFENSQISKLIIGQRYIAVMLNNGNIGVCATLKEDVKINFNVNYLPDLNSVSDRIFLNAYFNALFNKENQNYGKGDVTQSVDFSKTKKLVMIGYFRPVVERLEKLNVKVNIFDLRDIEISIPMEEQKKYLNECDAAIVSATTIFNNTFNSIAKNCAGDIHILGPSTIMHPKMLEYRNVKSLFGSLFKKNDEGVLDIIRQNLGTRHFLKLGEKVFLSKQLLT